MWHVYITKTQNKSLYTGMTANLERRLQEHSRRGKAIQLLYREPFSDKFEAARREKQIKGWTRRKKLALIEGNLELLKKL